MPAERGQPRESDEDETQEAVVERKDPKDPPRVEVAKVPVSSLGIVEDARDQEPGQDEEQVHPRPPRLAEGGHDPVQRHGRPEAAEQERVKDQDEQDRHPPNAVQSRQMRVRMQQFRPLPL